MTKKRNNHPRHIFCKGWLLQLFSMFHCSTFSVFQLSQNSENQKQKIFKIYVSVELCVTSSKPVCMCVCVVIYISSLFRWLRNKFFMLEYLHDGQSLGQDINPWRIKLDTVQICALSFCCCFCPDIKAWTVWLRLILWGKCFGFHATNIRSEKLVKIKLLLA